MSRFAILAFAICAALGGCAVGSGPSLSNLGLSESESETATADASMSAPASTKSAENSVLDNIWDNFSSAFRSGETPSPPAPKPEKGPEKKLQLDSNAALRLINNFRVAKGLKPLALEPRATKAAEMLAEDMAKHDRMSHYGPDGADVGKRLTLAGYPYRLAAENIGVGQSTLNEMVEDWEKSPPHRKNILLSDAKHMGIALDYNPASKYKTFWTLVIASP